MSIELKDGLKITLKSKESLLEAFGLIGFLKHKKNLIENMKGDSFERKKKLLDFALDKKLPKRSSSISDNENDERNRMFNEAKEEYIASCLKKGITREDAEKDLKELEIYF